MPRPKIRPIAPMSQERIQKFWQRVQIKGPEECWPWMGARDGLGYGLFLVHFCGTDSPGRHTRRAQRVAYYLHYGIDPVNLVCHKCDEPSCCNPAHLFEGTDFDNTQDRKRKGRSNRPKNPRGFPMGEEHPYAILNDASVREIRRQHESGERAVDIAREFGVNSRTVCAVVHMKTWKHVT